MERYRSATFTIEFLLDEDNNLHSTHVLHVQRRHEETWTGWQKTRLVDFLKESAGLNIPSDEPDVPEAEEAVRSEEADEELAQSTESEPLTPLEEEPRLTGTLHLHELEMVGVSSTGPGRILTHFEPFDVRLTLDLTSLQIPGNTPLNYIASIYGRRRSSPGLLVGETQGTMVPADTVTIKVKGNTLPEEGIYQLAARVIVGLPNMELRVRPGTTVVIDGGQVQVL